MGGGWAVLPRCRRQVHGERLACWKVQDCPWASWKVQDCPWVVVAAAALLCHNIAREEEWGEKVPALADCQESISRMDHRNGTVTLQALAVLGTLNPSSPPHPAMPQAANPAHRQALLECASITQRLQAVLSRVQEGRRMLAARAAVKGLGRPKRKDS